MSYNSYAKNSTFPPPSGGGAPAPAIPDFTLNTPFSVETDVTSEGPVAFADIILDEGTTGIDLWSFNSGGLATGGGQGTALNNVPAIQLQCPPGAKTVYVIGISPDGTALSLSGTVTLLDTGGYC